MQQNDFPLSHLIFSHFQKISFQYMLKQQVELSDKEENSHTLFFFVNESLNYLATFHFINHQ